MSSQHSITLRMLSDWHIGSGAGQPGSIDRLVKRDHEQFPIIPAKTLTGIWRDACEQVALGLDDNDKNGHWNQWLNYLFGDQPTLKNREGVIAETSPQAAILSVRPAELSITLRNALKEKLLLKEALTFVKPGVAIDSRSGCARPDYLRFEEMVRTGAELTATYTLNGFKVESDHYKTAQALLTVGAAMVERLGAKRRRGAGRCEVILNYSLEEALTWIEQHPEPDLPKTNSTFDCKVKPDEALAEGDWQRIDLLLKAKSPILIHDRTTGNVLKTLDYIPGTYLLPIVSKTLRQLGIDVGTAIARGDLIVTNALLQLNDLRGNPIPLSLFYQKSDQHKDQKFAYNRLQPPLESNSQLKGYRGGYIANGKDQVLLATVEKSLKTHNTVKDEIQRPNEDVGGVYSYEAIAQGTTLQAELRLRQSLITNITVDDLVASLSGEHAIGRTKKDDYGAVHITATQELSEPSNASQQPMSKQKADYQELTVWLLSDLLLRDKRLRPTTNLSDFTQALGDRLGVTLRVRGIEADENQQSKDKQLNFLARSHRVDSWQTRWSLPRPSLVGLSSGTCVVFDVIKGSLDSTTLKEIEQTGMGERRAEGYGQLCFNNPLLTQPKVTVTKFKPDENKPNQEPCLISKNDSAFSYAQILEQEAWREAIRKGALALANNETYRVGQLKFKIKREGQKLQSELPMSQLGGLRSVLGRLSVPQRLQQPCEAEECIVISWLNHLKDTKNRAEKWDKDSLKKIETLLTQPEQIWIDLEEEWTRSLHFDFSDITLTQPEEKHPLKKLLWAETIRTVIDACIRAHKRELEAQQSEVKNGKSH